jgi:hypothetical protein
MSKLSHGTIRQANLMTGLAVAATLLLAFRLWSFSYFWTDDFGNIFWIQSETLSRMIGYVVNPLSTFYRPVGMFAYWVLYHAFGLQPLPYHLVAWALHSLNTFLLFVILRRLLHSPFAAAAGAIPFAFRVNFADMYWSFGTIFELAACAFLLIGIYLYVSSRRRSWSLVLALSVIYMFAIKSKEMAISLVAVWILYDICVRREWNARLLVPLAIAGWFTYLKVSTMQDLNPADPYYIDLKLSTLMQGFGQYFNWLYVVKLPAILWLLAAAALAAILIYRGERVALFFLGYVFLTFLPVIFLVNHRWPYFWYIPFFGVAGLIGRAAKFVETRLRGRMPLSKLVLVNTVLIWSWAAVHSGLEYYRSRQTRAYEASLAATFESFVQGLRTLPAPEPGATFYFTAMPPHFHPEVLNAAVQVILHRPDIHAKLVPEFPEDATWKLRFLDGSLQRASPQ